MVYRIRSFQKTPDWEKADTARIGCYAWERDGYRPDAYAKLCLVDGQNLFLRMFCAEDNPRAVHLEPDSNVYEDSCLEFFVQPAGADIYLNFEMNSAGTLLCERGAGRQGRVSLRSAGLPVPLCHPLSLKEDDRNFWGVELCIPLSLFSAACHVPALAGKQNWKGNFYKCGDRTVHPHYGSWSPVACAEPCFHIPSSFGELCFCE